MIRMFLYGALQSASRILRVGERFYASSATPPCCFCSELGAAH